MARRDNKPSTITQISLWDGLKLFSEHCPQQLAEEKFVCEIAAKRVRSSPDDSDVDAFWKRLSVGGYPQILFPKVHWGESWIEFYTEGVRRTAYPIQVVQEDVLAQRPTPPAPIAVPARALASASRPKRRGKQINRVLRALRIVYPPDGRPSAFETIDTIRGKLLPHWSAANERYNLTDPSEDTVAAAVKQVGRRAD
jgi:hypothetical protein